MTSGALTAPRMRVTASVMSAISSRPTKAVQRSSVCEPSLTCSRPISTQPSQSPCSCSRRNCARAVGVAALADRQIGVLLAQRAPGRRARRREGAQAGLRLRGAGREPISADAAQHRVERGDVRRLGAAAAADDVDPVLEHEALEPLRELGGAQRVMGAGRRPARAGRHWAAPRSARASSRRAI